MTYAETMDRVKRERETETRVRAMDASDMVELIHGMEDEATERDATIATLTRRVEELEVALQWHPIETAPEKGQFLALNERRETVFQVFRTGALAPEEPGYLAVTEPIMGLSFYSRVWMPLPTPPQGDDHGA